MEDYFYSYLQVAKLEKYYPNFVKSGITRSNLLTNLKTIDYYNLGIKENRDQKKLFQLIDIIRNLDSEEHSGTKDTMTSSAVQQRQILRIPSQSPSSGYASQQSSHQVVSPEDIYRSLTGRNTQQTTHKNSPKPEFQRYVRTLRTFNYRSCLIPSLMCSLTPASHCEVFIRNLSPSKNAQRGQSSEMAKLIFLFSSNFQKFYVIF